MAERRVKVFLSAEVAGYRQAMEQASAATRKTKESAEASGKAADAAGKQATAGAKQTADASKAQADAAAQAAEATKKQYEAMTEVGQVAMIAGAATLAGVGMAVKGFADFDKQMSSVQAATRASAGDMDLLREAAVKAGADTAFSAVEAAQGIEELAKAGVSTKDILDGGLTGALDLAAAGELAVGEAAEIAATAMTQFKLSGDQLPLVADLLAAGAGKAQGSVQDLGMALNQSGLVASATGLTIEETTGTLAAFASAGLVGSDAGTSFKSMLQKLQNPSKEAAGVMGELGISMYDANGEFVGMSELAGQLQTSMSDLTQAERDKAMATIFGADAVRASNVLYAQGAAGIEEWEAAVNDAGYAAETAALKQDNLAGDLEKLGGAFDTFLINLGAGADGPLRGLVQGLEGVVDAAGRLPAPVLGAAIAGGTLLGAVALLGGGLITVIPKIAATRAAMSDLAPAGSRAAKGMTAMGKAAGGAALGLVAVAAAAGPLAELGNRASKATGENADALGRFAGEASKGAVAAKTLNTAFDDLVLPVEGLTNFQSAIQAIADPGIWGNTSNVLAGIVGIVGVDLTTASEEARNRFAEMGEELASLDAETAAQSFQSMAAETDGSQESLSRLLEYMPTYRDALEKQAVAAGMATDDQTLLGIATGELAPKMDEAAASVEAEAAAAEQAAVATEAMQEALADIGISADGAITSLETFVGVLHEAGLLTLSANDAARGYEAAIDAIGPGIEALIVEYGSLAGVLNETADGFNRDTDAGRAAEEMFDGLASAAASNSQAMADAGASQETLQGQLVTTYDSLITAAGQFGITGEQADALARGVMGIPVGVSIDTWMSDEAKRMAEETTGAADAVPDQVRIESSMSAAAKETADATKKSAEDIPNQETIDSWMSDAAFQEALRTRAAALGIPEREAIDSFMSSAARNEADNTTARILNIPPGASVSSFMSAYARNEADALKRSLDNVDGRVVNSYANFYETTIIREQREAATVDTGASDRGYSSNNTPGLALGGRVAKLAGGGRLPTTGPGTDTTDGILGISTVTGQPTAMVDSGEWVINGRSSDKWNNLLGAINRDDPRLANLQGFAAGGRMSREYAPSQSFAMAGGSMSATVDPSGIASAVSAAMAGWQPVVNIAGNRFAGVMEDVKRKAERN